MRMKQITIDPKLASNENLISYIYTWFELPMDKNIDWNTCKQRLLDVTDDVQVNLALIPSNDKRFEEVLDFWEEVQQKSDHIFVVRG